MGERNVKMCSLLYLIFLSFWMPQCVLSENNIGCLFSPGICETEEECFDDNVFGRCQLPYGKDMDLYRHFLGPETIQLLERELTRLFAGGYRWRHDYTQCVVQNILYSNRHEISYDPGLCSRIMQFTLPDVPPEILSEIEAPEPDELAFIKFKPNHDSPDGELYADEIFSPPIFSERDTSKNEKRDPVTNTNDRQWSHNYHTKEFKSPSRGSSLDDKEELIRELLKTAEDSEILFEGLQDKTERHPESSMPFVKTDLSSDQNLHPAFSEGGTGWSPIEDNEFPEGQLFDPFDKKRVRVTNHAFPVVQDTNPVIKITDANDGLSTQKFKPIPNKETPTFGRNPSDNDDDDASFRWNSKHRSKLMDDDLTRFAKGDEPRINKINPQSIEPESSDNSNLSDLIENDYLEDQLYAILPIDRGMSTFTRNMRYDTKKPGPTYMIHDDEDGDTTHDAEEMAGQEVDSFVSHLSQNIVHNQLLSLLKSPVGIQKSKSFVPNFEVTDETRRILLTSGSEVPSIPEIDTAKITATDKITDQKNTFERPAADQPELLEGIDDSSEHMRDEEKTANAAKTGEGHIGHYDTVAATHTYLLIKENSFQEESAQNLVETLGKMLGLPKGSFSNMKVEGRQITFKVNPNSLGYNASDVATRAEQHSTQLQKLTGLTIEGAGIGDKVKYEVINPEKDKRIVIIAFALCGAVAGILLAAGTAYLVRRHSRTREKLQNITQPDTEASQDYQDLCRQRMQSKANEKAEPVHSVHSPKKIRSLSQEGQASSSSHSSTSSWNEEPVTSNMDISTGHMILSYMEDHLKNKDRLDREWEALCAYEAELCATSAASQPTNVKKNRYTDVLSYDHSRVVLNELSNVSGSDYINASSITDHDPRNPAYIATQGPLPQTASDFWQMIWEQGSVVIVMLSRLMENGVAMCHRYWPEEGSEVYHIYEVHLVSEHIWCDDYLVRSFYLKNLRTSETRTVTQFHFMSWPDNGVPNSTKALLEFRRKVNKSYRGRSCPIVVHCSDGIGRTGTYCLIDMVLNRMSKGAKEIDIAATLEHVRDQRTGMVKTKAQFEFVLMAIAEEVHAILKALSQ